MCCHCVCLNLSHVTISPLACSFPLSLYLSLSHTHTHTHTHRNMVVSPLNYDCFFSICAEEMLSSPSYPCVLLTGGWNRMQRAVHRAATLGRGLLNSFMFLWSGY